MDITSIYGINTLAIQVPKGLGESNLSLVYGFIVNDLADNEREALLDEEELIAKRNIGVTWKNSWLVDRGKRFRRLLDRRI